ncbi:MAG: PD-(D/E)XK nuclease family protein [Oscillospiraceae bacterium]|nr:PD-(D/E)XK nuclease family protein [Oscillospiraceae bacterium]
MNEIKNTASEDCRAVLVVPEQSSFSYEKRLFFLLGPERSRYVEVRSFSRLADDINAAASAPKTRASDAAKAALVRRAMASLADSLEYYRKSRSDTAFFRLTARVIDECKNAAITPSLLLSLAERCEKKITGTKLREFALIFESYETLLSESYEDIADRISAASSSASCDGLFSLKTVYVDGFTGFTEPEYRLLTSMASSAREVVVTILGDAGNGGTLFSTVRRTEERLIQISEDLGGKTVVVELADKLKMAPGITALEEYLAGYSPGKATDGIHVISAADEYAELERVAAEITRLVRDEGYRYSDIAVIARDIERYRAMIRREFRLFDVPYFADWPENESFSSTAAFIKAALSLLEEFSADNLSALLKTSLTSLSAGEIASFEDYVYIWDIDSDELTREFVKHPDGLSRTASEQSELKLQQAETVRALVCRWATDFIGRAKDKSAREVIREIYALMVECGGVNTLTQRKEAEAAFAILEQLYQMLGEDRMQPKEISGIAETLLNETFTGEIPDTIEQVQVGSAERIRAVEPRAVFVVGLNEGIFPRTVFEPPLFSLSERDYINSNGGRLTVNFDNLAAMEELHLYNALTCASERVYLGIPDASVLGEKLQPSAVIAWYIESFSPLPLREDRYSLIVNEATARIAYLENAGMREEIRSAGIFNFCDRLDAAAEAPTYGVADTALLSETKTGEIKLSPSQIESFSLCRFAYFLRYTARILPLLRAEISPLEAGNFIHAVLEYVLIKTGGDPTSVDTPSLHRLCEEASDSYADEFLAGAQDKSALVRYQLLRLKAQAKRLLACLCRERQQSVFYPVDFELAIGDEGGVRPRTVVLPDSTVVKVRGKIDRVDVAEIDGEFYVRVVDYKTGSKKFSLDDVYYGLNIQMLIYLFSLTENGYPGHSKLLPAGVLYMPSDPQLNNLNAKTGAFGNPYRMDGLVLSDPRIVGAMEKDGEGVFIPVTTKDGVVKGAADKLADLEELGRIRRHIDGVVAQMAMLLRAGDIEASPTVKGNTTPCAYCHYTCVCRRDRITRERLIEKGAFRLLKGGEAHA